MVVLVPIILFGGQGVGVLVMDDLHTMQLTVIMEQSDHRLLRREKHLSVVDACCPPYIQYTKRYDRFDIS